MSGLSLQQRFLVVCLVLVQMCLSTEHNQSTWSRLRSDLLDHRYDVTEIPSIEDGIPLPVTLHLTLQAIKNVNEKEQSLIGTSTITLVWEDDRLTWMPSYYDNLSVLTLPYRMVWTPSLDILNTNFEDSRVPMSSDNTKVHIRNDGQITTETSFLHSTSCPMNLSMFPFDTQICYMMIASQDISTTNVVLVPGVFTHRADDRHPAWNVVSVVGSSRSRLDQSGVHEVSDLFMVLELQRLPHHYVFSIIIPVMLINTVGILSFLIPLKSGERVSTCISVVLGVTVFQIVINDVMPQTSRIDSAPRIVQYLCFSFIALVGIMLSSVVTLNISYRKESIKSKVWRIFFFRILATMVFKGREGRIKMTERKTQPATEGDDKDSNGINVSSFCEQNPTEIPLAARNSEEQVFEVTDMEFVAAIFDRLFFFMFILVELWMMTLLRSLFTFITQHR